MVQFQLNLPQTQKTSIEMSVKLAKCDRPLSCLVKLELMFHFPHAAHLDLPAIQELCFLHKNWISKLKTESEL